MCGQPGYTTGPHALLPPCFLGMNDLKTERSFDSKATWVIDVRALFFDKLPMGYCTISHWEKTGR